jgi:hypothetical protein
LARASDRRANRRSAIRLIAPLPHASGRTRGLEIDTMEEECRNARM